MKRSFAGRVTAFAAVFAVLAALSGCGSGSDSNIILYDSNEDAASKTRITFFGYKTDALCLSATENAMQSFMAENSDIDIHYEGIKGPSYWEAFDKREASGVLDDVVMMHHDHVVSMSAEGKLADLSGLSGVSNYSAEAMEQFVNPDGTVYFLPTSVSTYNLYVNYDLLKAHGQSVPENWQQFSDCCDYFANKGIVPIIANNLHSLTTLIVSRGLFDTYQQPDKNAALEKFNKDPALLAQALEAGVDLTAEMISRGWIDTAEALVTEQTDDDLELFLKGDRPFMISGGWASHRVMSMNPSFTYGVHPYPILEDGCVLSFQVDTCISVNAESPNIDAAKKFVDYLIQPDVMWEFCDSQASYTPLNDDRLPSETELIPSIQYLTNGRVVYRNEYRLDLPMEAALSACASTLLNGGTAEEAQAALYDVLTK